ncbi:MAG: putative ATP/GTP-binding protein [Acidimicrobiales bacterium]|nr:putative ATP/GTP-binding protein [Acidimicrobiales bacterium]
MRAAVPVTVGLLVILSVGAVTTTASAERNPRSRKVTAQKDSVLIESSATSGGGSVEGGRRTGGKARTRRRGPAPVCRDYPVASAVSSYDYENHGLGGELIPRQRNHDVRRARAWRRCTNPDGTVEQHLVHEHPAGPAAPPTVSPTQLLVAAAEARVEVTPPVIVTSPPRHGPQLVSLPVWFWVANREPLSATETIPGLEASVTAMPTHLQIQISGGTGRRAEDNVTIDCHGLGTPFDEHRHDVRASSDCSQAFDWNGTFTVTATLTWSLSWTATTGETGTLPTQRRTTNFPLRIWQAQAVTD